jgi:hypothetical protein
MSLREIKIHDPRHNGERTHGQISGSAQPLTNVLVSVACGSNRVHEGIRNFKYQTEGHCPWSRIVHNIPTDAWPHEDVWTGKIPPTDDEADAMMIELGDDDGQARYTAQDWSNYIKNNDKAWQYIQYTKSQLYNKHKLTRKEYERFKCSLEYADTLHKTHKRYLDHKRYRQHLKYTAYQQKTYTAQVWPAWLKEADEGAEYQRYRDSLMFNENINTRLEYETYRCSPQFEVDMKQEQIGYLEHKRHNEHEKYTNYQELLERYPEQMVE